MRSIFPWVETARAEYQERLVKYQRAGTDNALVYFLDMLVYFHRVLLQDAAVLATKHGSNFLLLNYQPFNTSEFRKFAEGSTAMIAQVEEEVRESLQNLPAVLAKSMTGVVESMRIENGNSHRVLLQQNQDMRRDIFQAISYVVTQPGVSRGKKRKFCETELAKLISGEYSKVPFESDWCFIIDSRSFKQQRRARCS